MREVIVPRWNGLDNRRAYWAYLFARLKPGITVEQARTAFNAQYRAILTEVDVPLQQDMSAVDAGAVPAQSRCSSSRAREDRAAFRRRRASL